MRFEAFAQQHGLILTRAVADGKYHRVRTTDHPAKRNGAYALSSIAGAVRNFATMDAFAIWRPNGDDAQVDRAAMLARLREAEAEERAQHAAAAIEARAIVNACQRLRHSYLIRKGFPTVNGLVHGQDLIVPMNASQGASINSVQRIAPDGTKRFLPGGKARGSVFRIGVRGPIWLVEGYATGLSVMAALEDLRQDARIVVCFSAGNLIHVAEKIRWPAFVFADNDESGVGEQAALATGIPYCISPDWGDANDLHVAKGLRAVCRVILSVQDAL